MRLLLDEKRQLILRNDFRDTKREQRRPVTLASHPREPLYILVYTIHGVSSLNIIQITDTNSGVEIGFSYSDITHRGSTA
jgi:hypothetical protein